MTEQLSRAVAAEIRRLLEERGLSGNHRICRALDVRASDLLEWAQRS
jgi:hypothetical protein